MLIRSHLVSAALTVASKNCELWHSSSQVVNLWLHMPKTLLFLKYRDKLNHKYRWYLSCKPTSTIIIMVTLQTHRDLTVHLRNPGVALSCGSPVSKRRHSAPYTFHIHSSRTAMTQALHFVTVDFSTTNLPKHRSRSICCLALKPAQLLR